MDYENYIIEHGTSGSKNSKQTSTNEEQTDTTATTNDSNSDSYNIHDSDWGDANGAGDDPRRPSTQLKSSHEEEDNIISEETDITPDDNIIPQ